MNANAGLVFTFLVAVVPCYFSVYKHNKKPIKMADKKTDAPKNALVTPASGRVIGTRSRSADVRDDPLVCEDFGFGDGANVNSCLRIELERLAPGLNKHDKKRKQQGLVDPNAWKTHLLNEGAGAKKQVISSPLVSKKAKTSSVPDSPDTDYEEESPKAPAPSRSIVEHAAVSDLIRSHALCAGCNQSGSLQLQHEFPSVGVASIPTLSCETEGCSLNKQPEKATVQRTVFHGTHATKHERLVDFATNMSFVTAFTASGDGGTEAERLLAMLDLPNATTMCKTSYRILENALLPAVQRIVEDAIQENLFDEVRFTMSDVEGFDFEVWKLCYETNQDLPAGFPWPMLKGSMDMGWNNRGGGRRFDSQSGHAFFVGFYTRKPISWSVKSRYCSFCSYMEAKKVTEVPEHSCKKTHDGSAGSMEPQSLVDMIEALWDDYNCAVSMVITDDDSKMQAMARWSNEDYKAHHNLPSTPIVGWTQPRNPEKTKPKPIKRTSGSLRHPVHPPLFGADPAHRKKSLRNQLYDFRRPGKYKSFGLEEGDILRLTTSFVYMLRQLSDEECQESEYETRAKAVLEHHFDNHEYCGTWCKRKMESEEERSKSTKYYRCKKLNANLYSALQGIMSSFIDKDQLKECAHGGDTNMNESLNNLISWFAPKNKTYAGTDSLVIRVGMAIGIHSLGYDIFFCRLYQELGLEMGEGTKHALEVHEDERCARMIKEGSSSWRQRRNQKVYKKVLAYHARLRSDISQGTQYESGVRMKKEHHCGNQTSRSKNTASSSATCPLCGKRGHKTQRSKKCAYYGKPVPQNLSTHTEDADEDSTEGVIETTIDEKTDTEVVAETFALLDGVSLSTDDNVAELSSELDEMDL